MTVNRGPGVAPIAGVGTTTLEHRLQLAGIYAENAPGVPRSGVLAQATDQLVVGRADMSYDVGPAALVINRTAGEGVYTPTLTGTTNVATDAAPGTNSRWDLIYVKQNDQAKGDADNAAVIGVQKGVAAASPTKPTADLPAGAYVLAEARIFALTTGTSGGSNTIAQVWRHTAARGAQVKVRSATERAEITAPAKGLEILRTDLTQAGDAGVVERWNGAQWDHFGFAQWTTTAGGIPGGTVSSAGGASAVASKTTDSSFVTLGSGAGLTARDAGTYTIEFTGKWSVPSPGRAFFSLDNIAAPAAGATVYSRSPIPATEDIGTVSAKVNLAAGETVYVNVYRASGTSDVSGILRVSRESA